jgi:hypothetical protein
LYLTGGGGGGEGILTGGWRKLLNAELRNFWSSQTASVTESRKLAVVFHVKHVAEFIYTCKILVGISEGKSQGDRFKK